MEFKWWLKVSGYQLSSKLKSLFKMEVNEDWNSLATNILKNGSQWETDTIWLATFFQIGSQWEIKLLS